MGSLWPRPFSQSSSENVVKVDVLNFVIDGGSGDDVVKFAVDHYQSLIRDLKPTNGKTSKGQGKLLTKLSVSVTGKKKDGDFKSLESCKNFVFLNFF